MDRGVGKANPIGPRPRFYRRLPCSWGLNLLASSVDDNFRYRKEEPCGVVLFLSDACKVYELPCRSKLSGLVNLSL